MAESFPLSDTISFETDEGWYDLMITTAYLPASLTDTGRPGYRTVADLHAPHSNDGEATLLDALMADYADAASARAGHARLVEAVEERAVPLPLPAIVRSERKLRS